MIEKQSRINNWSISVTLHRISWIALAGTTVKVGLGLYLIKLDKVCDCFLHLVYYVDHMTLTCDAFYHSTGVLCSVMLCTAMYVVVLSKQTNCVNLNKLL